MLINIIIFFIILITLVYLLNYSRCFKEGFLNSPDGIPDSSHNLYVDSSQKKFNELTNLVNLTDPSIQLNPNSQKEIDIALQTTTVSPSSGAFQITGVHNDKIIPKEVPSSYKLAEYCESKSTDCSAFDDSEFASNCGMSFDPKGKSHTGKTHIGGKFIFQNDRNQQLQQMSDLNSAGQDGYTALRPTLGTSKPGSFALTKDQCIVVKERIECEKKQTFNSPNCTQCYTSGLFHRVDPSTGRLPCKLRLFGSGFVEFFVYTDNSNLNINGTFELNSTEGPEINLPADAEGSKLQLYVVSTTSENPYILGYIEGQTPRGSFKLDLLSLIETDIVTSAKPKLGGANIVNGFRSFVIIPGTGQKQMNLIGMIPFSFLSLYDGDARTCDNGPIITQAASATFLESDPCFGKKNKPGNYTMACLQERWMELGGTAQGTGYPSTPDKANAIQIDSNGNPLDIDTIVNNIYPKMTQASTGLNTDGSPMTIPQWNTVSMWGLGIPINTPCDGSTNQTGPVSQECLEYLYLNQGAQSHIGATYTLPLTDSSLKGSINGSNTYCQPGMPIDPSTPSGKQYIQAISQNGIQAVKSVYDQIHRSANDNTLSNEARKQAVNQCYGINMDVLTGGTGKYMGSAVTTEAQPILAAIYGSNWQVAVADSNIFNSNINWNNKFPSISTISYTIYDTALTPDGTLLTSLTENIGSVSINGVAFSKPYTSAGIVVTTPSFNLQQIATDGNIVCGVDVNNNPWYANVQTLINTQSASSFVQIQTGLQKIVPYNGGFVCIGLDKYIRYLTSPSASSWNKININGNNWILNDIAIDGSLVLFIGKENNLYYTTQNLMSSGVTAYPITMPPGVGAQSVSVSKQTVAFVDTNGNYWFCSDYTSPNWQQITGSGGVKIRHRIP